CAYSKGIAAAVDYW
nr:immunoglobulin heavy chain junction region [Macaca mulatta]